MYNGKEEKEEMINEDFIERSEDVREDKTEKYEYKIYNDEESLSGSYSSNHEPYIKDDENIHGPNAGNMSGNDTSRTLSGDYETIYNIWSFDGKLLAEYDENGVCVKNYIYMGKKLIAEYLPQTNEYYYFMSDQINSSRVVTDGTGTVVYSAAYGPYGDIQKVWTNTYEPKLKFSGKERNVYSNLDYFGARYYDNKSYRFTSVDPIINREEALTNPQLWNLYAYCRNNPITYYDPDGRDVFKSIKKWWKKAPLSSFVKGDFKGGFKKIGENLDRQLSDPMWVTGFIGGVKFKGGSALGKTSSNLVKDLISGRLKKSKSFFSELADKTVEQLDEIAKSKSQQAIKAKKMQKLIKQQNRLKEKLKNSEVK